MLESILGAKIETVLVMGGEMKMAVVVILFIGNVWSNDCTRVAFRDMSRARILGIGL